MKNHENSQKETINQSKLLDMGWTKTLIEKYLPRPILKNNPMYHNSTPMKLWYIDDVRQVMLKHSFKEDMKKVKKCKIAAFKGVKNNYRYNQKISGREVVHI